jgi:hypothetical protein
VLVPRRGEGDGARALVGAQSLDHRSLTVIGRQARFWWARGYSLVNQRGNHVGILLDVCGVRRNGERVR